MTSCKGCEFSVLEAMDIFKGYCNTPVSSWILKGTGEDEPHGDIRKGPRPTRPGDGKGGPGKRKAVVGMESWRGRL